jgi:hypothetical protein
MDYMFYGCNVFNGDLSAWVVTSVNTTEAMFEDTFAFNGDLGAWDLAAVATMDFMFQGASSFDRDLNWCVLDAVTVEGAFRLAPCADSACGVTQVMQLVDCA